MVEKAVAFYFDFMSPYSYLAHTQLPDLVAKYGYILEYHPIDIPSAKIAAGNYGPSNRSIAPKFEALLADLERWAERYDVPFEFPPNLNCKYWNIGVLYAQSANDVKRYVDSAYRIIWGEGQDPERDDHLERCAEEMSWLPDEFKRYVHGEQAASSFRKACVDAHNRGVFGAPIMMLDDRIWWGNDRLTFLEEYLQQQ